MKDSTARKKDRQPDPMRVAADDRKVALARSAEVKALIAEFLKVKDKIPTGLKLEKEYTKAKKRILKVLGGSEKDWGNYKWHLKNRIENVDTLGKIVRLSRKEINEIRKTGEQYRWGISPYYASLIDPADSNCPVRKQAIPSIKEHLDTVNRLEDARMRQSLISRTWLDGNPTHRFVTAEHQ